MALLRRLRSATVVALLALAIALLAVAPVAAGRKWCRKDPGFLINNRTEVNVEVGVPEHLQDAVTGPLNVILFVPEGVPAKVTFTDEGFNGRGEQVEIVHDPRLGTTPARIPLRVQVLVPVDGPNFQVAVFLTTSEGKSAKAIGKANRPVEVRSAVSASA